MTIRTKYYEAYTIIQILFLNKLTIIIVYIKPDNYTKPN